MAMVSGSRRRCGAALETKKTPGPLRARSGSAPALMLESSLGRFVRATAVHSSVDADDALRSGRTDAKRALECDL
jgi:hypothetical protein